MKIFIVEGSPHKNGSSNLLADSFIAGAREAGHEIDVFDAAGADIHGCIGCGACGMAGPCRWKDDMVSARERLLGADMVVLVTPLYYYQVSSYLKRFIERFYSFSGELTEKHLKSALIVAAWDSNDWTMDCVSAYYKTLCRYLDFQDQGMILGCGCGSLPLTRATDYPGLARQLGSSL
jgi:multimeric flavodoxin WrbA